METINKEHFKTIRKAIENNKLAVFVGSAVSFDSKLPSWGELIESMTKSLELSGNNDYLKIAEHYYLEYGRNTYYNKINDFFPSGSQPNDLHDLILSLKPQHIVTTNWDNLLEKSISKKGELYFTVTTDHELASSPSSKLLVKMHGDLSHRNIVFKESDYLSYSDNFPLIENFVKSLFSTHVVIFIGYSISDFNLNQILKWIKNRTNDAPPSFSILTSSKINLSELNYLRGKGVYPLTIQSVDESIGVKYPKLSGRSIKAAQIIEHIIFPQDTEKFDVIDEIAKDISEWNIVHPVMIVRLLRNRLNITEVNKIYYDSGLGIIIYHLSPEEQNYTRSQYRRFRKSWKKIQAHLPIKEIRLLVGRYNHYKLKNINKFHVDCEYSTFNIKAIINRVSSPKIFLENDLDGCYEYAFDNYFLKNHEIARSSFLHVANQFFLKSRFVKSIIASFNKKHLCFESLSISTNEEFYEVVMGEQLSINDNISELIEKFPKSLIKRQSSLFQDLDASNTFILKHLCDISELSREIDDEIELIVKGGYAFTKQLPSMYNKLYCLVLFVLKNKITILYSSDFQIIGQLSFQSIVKRLSIAIEPSIKIDRLLSFTAIISFQEKELVKFLVNCLDNDKYLEINDDKVDYLLEVMDNSINSVVAHYSKDIINRSIGVWSKALTLLSYRKNEFEISDRIADKLIHALDTQNWFNLSEAISRFLVLQSNRYQADISFNKLTDIFNKQISKLSQLDFIPYQEDGILFKNLLYLLKNNHEANESYVIKENRSIDRFISKIPQMDLQERLRAINLFVFVIHFFAGESLKHKTTDLLKATYQELKDKCDRDIIYKQEAILDDFDLHTIESKDDSELEFMMMNLPDDTNEEAYEWSLILYGLDLYEIGIIEEISELDFIMGRLVKLVERSIQNNSFNSNLVKIKYQLSRIDIAKIAEYKKTVEDVSRLTDRFKMF
jgi:SIR2-like domain